MEQAIADDPEAHPVIPGTNGVRKARWARQGGGKSAGVRVIYYHLVIGAEIHLLALYAKSEQANLDAAERKKAKKYVEELKRAKKNQSN